MNKYSLYFCTLSSRTNKNLDALNKLDLAVKVNMRYLLKYLMMHLTSLTL